MTVSEVIKQLQVIQEKYGDISVVGGYLMDDTPLEKICVISKEGWEVFPESEKRPGDLPEIEGVFLS